MLSLYAGLPRVWLTLKRIWIADVVAVRRIPANLAYFETTFESTLDCRFVVAICRIPIHLAYSETILDCRFAAVRRNPVLCACFETTLDFRFCRYMQDSFIFGLLRNDLGFQILSLYTGFPHMLLTSKRPWIVDVVAMRRVPAHLVHLETTLD
jgi:hypothetical protein